ncbi:MAG: nucleotidyltransferase domain-containing protein [Anaerolineae bacterium]|nr:nucleotidyltransferase domain-containing protein [Anaerolineae bacterium]
MPTALELTPETMAVYRATVQRRRKVEEQAHQQRQQLAWQLARRAAALLKEQFGATRVVVFGSLIHEDCFTPWSDVDLAAWGIALEDTFRAMGAVMDLSREIEINLVDINACRPSLLATIEQEGITL